MKSSFMLIVRLFYLLSLEDLNSLRIIICLCSAGNPQEEGAERRSTRSYSILGQIINDV
jgi:hypothetical protein